MGVPESDVGCHRSQTPFGAIKLKEEKMKANPIYATLTAAVLMLTSASFVRADDGGKGPGANSGKGNNNSGQVTETRLRSKLAGGKLGTPPVTPEGSADFRSDTQGRTRLDVEVENVSLPDGTVLTVAFVHAGVSTSVGTITLNSALPENELELDSQHGAVVPALVAGDMITVSNGATVILAGALQ